MKRKIAAIALTATITGGVGAVAVPATGAFADGLPEMISQTSESPSKEQAEKQLKAKTNTARVSVVDGGDAYEDPTYYGAVITGNDTIEFYAYTGDHWTKMSERSILDAPFEDDVDVNGYAVEGLDSPVFLVDGTFTGDGTGSSLAFTQDSENNWGVLEGKGDQLVPSGHGISELGDPGLELSIDVKDGGELVTQSLWGPGYDESFAEQTSDPIIRTWKGSGDSLTMTSESGGPIG